VRRSQAWKIEVKEGNHHCLKNTSQLLPFYRFVCICRGSTVLTAPLLVDRHFANVEVARGLLKTSTLRRKGEKRRDADSSSSRICETLLLLRRKIQYILKRWMTSMTSANEYNQLEGANRCERNLFIVTESTLRHNHSLARLKSVNRKYVLAAPHVRRLLGGCRD